MTQELWILVLAAFWGLMQVMIAAVWPLGQRGYMGWNSGPRDEAFDFGPVAGRMRRAYQNYLETFPFFAALIVAAAIAGHSDGLTFWGAAVYLMARLVYFPAYAAGTKIRSAAFAVSMFGILAIVFSLVRSAL